VGASHSVGAVPSGERLSQFRSGGYHDEETMPLDEREQRILHEIEKGLYEQDPGLARKVGRLSRVGARRSVIAVIAFILGLVVTLATFAFNQWLALGGFVTMVLSGSAFLHARRATGSPAKPDWMGRFRGGGSRPQ
jgi:hypothetical protein